MFRIFAFFVSLLALNITWAQANKSGPVYSFEGQQFKLDPYVKVLPRPLDDKRNERLNLDDFPNAVDLKAYQTIVKNQGDRGSCAFFATNAVVESLVKKTQNIDVNFSEEYLIWKVKAEYGSNPFADGSFSDQNVRLAVKAGFVLERDLPFEPSWFNKGLPCANYSSGAGSQNPISCYVHNKPSAEVFSKVIPASNLVPEIYEPSSQKVIEILAASQQPVIVGVPVNPNGWDEKTGVVIFNEELSQECDNKPGLCGGHAIVLIGYDKAKKVFTFKNSWGASWGQSGYGTISFDYIDQYAHNKIVSAHLKGAFNIPSDYDQAPERSLEVKSVTTDMNQGTDGKVASIKIQASAHNLNNHIFYTSVFLGTPANLSAPVSDTNFSNVSVLKDYQKQYGSIVRDGISRLFKENEVQVDVDAALNLPFKIADLSHGTDHLFMRISTYYYSDIDGWKIITRSYDPVQL